MSKQTNTAIVLAIHQTVAELAGKADDAGDAPAGDGGDADGEVVGGRVGFGDVVEQSAAASAEDADGGGGEGGSLAAESQVAVGAGGGVLQVEQDHDDAD